MEHDLEEQVLNLSDVVHDEETSDHDDTDSVQPNSSPKSSSRGSPELDALSSTVRAFPGTTEASSLNLGNEEEPYSVENLEREITTLLNQNASAAPSALLDGANEQRHDSGDLDKDTNRHLDAIINGSLGLNLHGLAAMLQAANSANQRDSCDALSSKGPRFTAHADLSPHEYRNTRTAPSFHSLTAGESSEHPSRNEGIGRRKGSDDSTYLYTDDESDGDDVAGRGPDSDDRIPDTSPPNGASSPSTPAADQGGFSDINDILHHLSARLEPEHAHDGITPESSPIVSHSQDVDDASSDPISPPLPVSRAPPVQPRYASASTSHSHIAPTTARRPRGAAKEKDKGPHTCTVDDCNKTFTRKSDLARHMRIHTGERPFVCSHRNCGKTFIQRSALQVHTRVHTGEKPHSCEYPGCGKTFGDSSSLARHRRTHTGKRPYKCEDPQCEKTFTRRTTLTQHMRTHDPHWEPDPNIRYNFKSKKPKFGLEDEREIEDSVRTISAMFHGGMRPPYGEYGHYNQPAGNQVSTITAGIAAAIAKVNTSGILEDDSDEEYDDDADEGSGQEIESAPDVIGPNTSSIRGDDTERSDARVPEGRITDPTVFSLPLRTKKAKDPVAGVGVKRKR